ARADRCGPQRRRRLQLDMPAGTASRRSPLQPRQCDPHLTQENLMTSAVLTGLGAWVPPRRVTNEMLAAQMNTSDEWITSRTGIRARYMAEPGIGTSHLARHAGARALESA